MAIADGREDGHAVYATRKGRKVAWTCRKGREAVLPEPPPEAWTMDATVRDLECDRDEVFAMAEWKEKEKVLVGHRSGLLYECPSNGPELEEPELVGQVPGLCGLATSPDGEHMVIATGQGKLIQLNSEYEVLAEVELGEGFEEMPVTITWRGDGKFLATSSCHGGSRAIKVWERDGLVHHSDGEVDSGVGEALSWEPRGGLLAITAEEGGAVQMLERNGLRRGGLVLQQSQGTIEQLCWNADSELLGVLLEHKDGRGGGDTPHQGEDDVPFEKKIDVQLWHRCNHHWYLKWQEPIRGPAQLLWDDTDAKTLHIFSQVEEGWTSIKFVWDDATVTNLGTTVTTDGSTLLLNSFMKAVIPPPMCNVAILCSAPVTAVCASTFAGRECVAAILSSKVLAVAISEACGEWNTFPANVFDGSLVDAVEGVVHAEEAILGLPERWFVRQVSWQGPQRVLLLVDDFSTGALCERLVSVEISWGDRSAILADVVQNTCLNDIIEYTGKTIARITSMSDGGSEGVLISIIDKRQESTPGGHLSSVVSFDGSQLQEVSKCRGCCHWLLPLKTDRNGLISFAARSAERELFVGGEVVASNVRSFGCHFAGAEPTVLYVTGDNILHSLRLAVKEDQEYSNLNGIRKSLGGGAANLTAQGGNWQRRAVESGARLIAVPSDCPTVVLQMPRGNLEGIYPRSLVLDMVLSMLEKECYSEAFAIACRHRVDLNILVDYKWPFAQSKTGAHTLVVSLADAHKLVELVHALKPENSLQKGGVYAGTVQFGSAADPTGNEKGAYEGKINKVCEALRIAMEELDAPYYALPILSTYFRSQPPQLGDALLYATKLCLPSNGSTEEASLSHTTGDRSKSSHTISMSKMMKHLLVYCDEESLYKAALALYNLELAAVVVSYAQAMDPGEKLPELEAFDDISPIEKQHAHIDLYLGRLPMAAKNFALAGDWPSFEKSVTIAKQAPEDVFPVLLQHFPNNCSERATEARFLRIALGESLLGRGRAEEAAVAYLSGGDLEQAMHAYRTAGAWRMVLSLAGKLGRGDADVKSLALELAEELLIGAPKDSATILIDYVHDVHRGVEILASTGAWREALSATYRCSRPDLVDTLLAPAAAAGVVRALDDFKEDNARLKKYIARLRTLRQRRAALAAAVGPAAEDFEVADADNEAISEVGTSVMSDYSAYTHRSAVTGTSNDGSSLTSASAASCVGRRNRRRGKKDKKKGRIRAGAPNEEYALLQHLKECPMASHRRESYGELAELLIVLGHEQDAKTLQTTLSNLVAFQDSVAKNSILAMKEIEGSTQAKFAGPHQVEKAKWKWALLRGEEEASDYIHGQSFL